MPINRYEDEGVARLWNKKYDQAYHPYLHGRQSRVLDMIRDLNLAKGSKVLELGCGGGQNAIKYAELGFEVDGVEKTDYWKVVEHCYLCDLCYMTKCPYVPPHEWNVDFPHLMLRAKAQNFKKGNVAIRDKVLTSTDKVGAFFGIPVVAQTANLVNTVRPIRKIMEKTVGIHSDAVLPKFYSNSLRKSHKNNKEKNNINKIKSNGKVGLFVTCYGNRNEPEVVKDLIAVLEHNNLEVKLVHQEKCCGMPKMELGDLKSVEDLKDFNIPNLLELVIDDWSIDAPIPSCVLMFKKNFHYYFLKMLMCKKLKMLFTILSNYL